jgi:crossover junction endodeoxyribonuclease RuvC
MILLGLDPGLTCTGWGIIRSESNHLTGIANGAIKTGIKLPIAERLRLIHEHLLDVIDQYRPDESAVEETFVSRNGQSTLRLGHARGVVLLAPATRGLPVAEYAANLVKKTVTGSGHASKAQIQTMVSHLLPGQNIKSEDAADALAVAICHAHHMATRDNVLRSGTIMAGAGSVSEGRG